MIGDDRCSIGVCIATCRRPSWLARTLQSLSQQDITDDRATVRIVVVDNDSAQEGRAAAEGLRPHLRFPVETAYAPQPGISFARNLGVQRAGPCTYLAFIDDDEEAAPNWLSELLDTATRTGAEAVLGPVERSFESGTPTWLAALWQDPNRTAGQRVPDGAFRSGNLLLRADAITGIEGPFDPAFALSGGSDYVLGQALCARGARFVWAPNAVVTERVPAARGTLNWYLRRRYRTGLTYVRAQRAQRGHGTGSLRGLVRGAGSLGAGGAGVLAALPSLDRKRAAAAVGLLSYGLGNLVGGAGGHYQEYRRDER